MEKGVHGNTKHGYRSKNGRRSPTYQSWQAMKQRSLNPNCPAYKDYGGRGIKVCERWMDFANFLTDMGERPKGKTLDRINNDGDYEPGNCRWSTPKEQNQNQRIAKDRHSFIAINKQGEVVISNNQSEFARQYGLGQGNIAICLSGRLKSYKGWRFRRIPSLSGESLIVLRKIDYYIQNHQKR